MDSREQILHTSFKLFLQKSFKAVTMKEIVEHSGLSKGAFYHYFSSKEQVFEEVLDYFFSDFLKQDFSSFSHRSLREFCDDYIQDMAAKIKSAKKLGINGQEGFTANHYFLLFDGLKMLPEFKEKFLLGNKEELRNWKKIMKMAREKGEIRTSMSDEQLAKTFIYLSDGFGIHSILNGDLNRLDFNRNELEALWGGLYTMLKA